MKDWVTVKNRPTSNGVSPPNDRVSNTTTNGFTIPNTGGQTQMRVGQLSSQYGDDGGQNTHSPQWLSDY